MVFLRTASLFATRCHRPETIEPRDALTRQVRREAPPSGDSSAARTTLRNAVDKSCGTSGGAAGESAASPGTCPASASSRGRSVLRNLPPFARCRPRASLLRDSNGTLRGGARDLPLCGAAEAVRLGGGGNDGTLAPARQALHDGAALRRTDAGAPGESRRPPAAPQARRRPPTHIGAAPQAAHTAHVRRTGRIAPPLRPRQRHRTRRPPAREGRLARRLAFPSPELCAQLRTTTAS